MPGSRDDVRPSRIRVLVLPLVLGLAVTVAAVAFPRSEVRGNPVVGPHGSTNRAVGAFRLPIELTWADSHRALRLTASSKGGCRYRLLSAGSTAPNRLEVRLALPRQPCRGTNGRQILLLPAPAVDGPIRAVTVLVNGRGYPVRR